jgi:hypothetical protein
MFRKKNSEQPFLVESCWLKQVIRVISRKKLHTCFLRQPSPLNFQSRAVGNLKTSLFLGLYPEKTSPCKPKAHQDITWLLANPRH